MLLGFFLGVIATLIVVTIALMYFLSDFEIWK